MVLGKGGTASLNRATGVSRLEGRHTAWEFRQQPSWIPVIGTGETGSQTQVEEKNSLGSDLGHLGTFSLSFKGLAGGRGIYEHTAICQADVCK